MAWCSRCLEDLPAEDFNARSDRPSGLQSRCKACAREASRESQRRLRADPAYAVIEQRARQEARRRARAELKETPHDPIADVLARLDARLARGPLKGPVKVRHPVRAAKPRRVA